jgi:hypothetical protein
MNGTYPAQIRRAHRPPKRLNITINAVMAILARASARHAAIQAERL